MNLQEVMAEFELELERTTDHLKDVNQPQAIRLLVIWMGTEQAKEMNDFWDESR